MENFIAPWLIFNLVFSLPFSLVVALTSENDCLSYSDMIKNNFIPVWTKFSVFGKIIFILSILFFVPAILIYYIIVTMYKIGQFILSLCIKGE